MISTTSQIMMSNDPKGILLVNKSKGKTSFSLVSILRKITKVKKIGHAGTLDPFATGVMVMLVGKEYTKMSDKFLNNNKEYKASLHLGYETESYDIETEKIFISDKIPSLEEINNCINHFSKEIKQVPPMYSAKKINGKKLYELARKGKTITRPEIKVTVDISLIKYEYPYLEIYIKCSKGTYIRSLANDIGKYLECGAYLNELCRTRSGDFKLEDCIDQTSLFSENINLFFKS